MEQKSYDKVIIDVREPEEFSAKRIPGSLNFPLSAWGQCLEPLLNEAPDLKPIFTCLSGTRARMAAVQWQQKTGKNDFEFIDGGLEGWVSRGGRTLGAGSKSGMSIFRQVQMIVGPAILISSSLVLLDFKFAAWISLALGAGLTIAGYTGFCGLGILISKLNSKQKMGNCTR